MSRKKAEHDDRPMIGTSTVRERRRPFEGLSAQERVMCRAAALGVRSLCMEGRKRAKAVGVFREVLRDQLGESDPRFTNITRWLERYFRIRPRGIAVN